MSTPKQKIRAIVHQISNIEFTGEKGDYARQKVVLYCPAPKDQHTQKPIGKDEFFECVILGNKVDELNIHTGYQDQVVEVEIRFSGFVYKKKDGTGRGYGINCHLVNMKILQAAAEEYTMDAVELSLGY